MRSSSGRRPDGAANGSPTVLVAHPSPELYGSDRMLLESVAGLVTHGWRTVVTLPTTGPLVAELLKAGAEVEICAAPVIRKSALSPAGLLALGLLSARSVRSGLRLLHKVQPAVVLVNTVTIPGWTILARASRRPVIVHVHEAEERIPRVLRSLLAVPQAASNVIIVNSLATGRVLASALPTLRGRMELIYNGVAGPKGPGPARAQLTGSIRLIFVGRLSPRKGPDLVVEAVRLLRADGRDVEVDMLGAVFAGYEWFEAELRRTVQDAGLAEFVHFRGFIDPVWPAYEVADIAVFPSRDSEPFGNVSIEAQLARRPVVVSAVQGLVETVDGGRRGSVVAPDDAAGLAGAIAALIDDWPAATARAERARAQSQQLFAPDRYREDIAAVVTRLASNGRRRGNRHQSAQ